MIPVLLCGGAGTRLWPVSRSKMPKQFISLLERSLFELSAKRLEPFGLPYVVAVREFESLTQAFAKKLGLPLENLLSEPFAKNTAPAVALLCRTLEMRGLADEVAGIFPADHVISNEKEFSNAVSVAVKKAEEGGVVTLGIRPSEPSTGFGYIELESAPSTWSGDLKAFRSIRFREKPDLATAREYVSSGRYVWNAGIFFFKVSSMIEIFQSCAPELWYMLKTLKPDFSNLESVYRDLPSISFDYAVMEKLDRQFCIPCDLGWSDLGSWDDVVEFARQTDGPRVPNLATVFSSESKNCFAYSERKKTVAFVDVEDIVAIETPDATLIYRRGSSQNVRHIVDQMKKAGRHEVQGHDYEVMPWGRFELLEQRETFATYLVSVSQDQSVSSKTFSETRNRRDEKWVVVSGRGELTLAGKSVPLTPGTSVAVSANADWSIANGGQSALEVIAVQAGV
jgi:mannose-1-phosphate guanylyltransferase/mannose-6-phosphate isomerase